MSSPKLTLELSARLGEAGCGRHVFRVAGVVVESDLPLTLLAPFASNRVTDPGPAPSSRRAPLDAPGGGAAHRASGWLAGARRDVQIRLVGEGYRIDVGGLGVFVVAKRGDKIRCLELSEGIPRTWFEEALLGPPLALALALRDIWCLHASGVSIHGGVCLLLGASGAGKSTLAARLDGDGRRRVADDIAPCAFNEDHAPVMMPFPQMKLDTREQARLAKMPALPLRGLVLIEAAGPRDAFAVRVLGRSEAVKSLAQQSVAIGLFARGLREAHLRFLATLASTLPVLCMRYPHNQVGLEGAEATLMQLSKGSNTVEKPLE